MCLLWENVHCLSLGSKDYADQSNGNRFPQCEAYYRCKTETLMKIKELF